MPKPIMKGLFENLQEAAFPALWKQIAFLIALPYHTHRHKPYDIKRLNNLYSRVLNFIVNSCILND